MNIEIQQKNTKMLIDFHRYNLPSGPPPIEFLHRHNYTEIHIVSQGSLTVATNTSHYSVKNDSAVIIPPGFHHSVSTDSAKAKWFSFLTATPYPELAQKQFPEEFLTGFFQKLDNNLDGRNSDSIVNYITFICNELVGENTFSILSDRDYMEEIYNFLTSNYAKDIHTSDISRALHISETHIYRIIRKHTGKTFGELLYNQRMLVADTLAKQGKTSLHKIAEIVGYNSYSGFYKAYTRYKENAKNGM